MVIMAVRARGISSAFKRFHVGFTAVWPHSFPFLSRSLTLSTSSRPLDDVEIGMFVSESKFLSSPSSFIPHILTPNPSALEGLITKPAVEAALLLRLEKKARWYGSELGADGEVVRDESKSKVDVGEVVRLYREYIIPLTKEVEVRSSLLFSSSSLCARER